MDTVIDVINEISNFLGELADHMRHLKIKEKIKTDCDNNEKMINDLDKSDLMIIQKLVDPNLDKEERRRMDIQFNKNKILRASLTDRKFSHMDVKREILKALNES